MASNNTPARRRRNAGQRSTRTVTGGFQRIDTLRERDRRTEVARKYYPNGRVEAERLRIRETERRDRLTLPAGRKSGFLSTLFTNFGGGLVFFVVGSSGFLIFDTWWGPAATLGAFAFLVTIRDL